jgi:hypothetical protein
LVLKNRNVHFDGLGLKTIEGGFAGQSSKPCMDSLVVWASKPSAAGLTSLGLKIREWPIDEHMVSSQSLHRGEAMLRRHWVRRLGGYLVRVLHVRKT